MEGKFTEYSSKSEKTKNWYFGSKPPNKEERIQRNEERIQRMK